MLKWIVFWESVWARERNGFADYQNCRSGFYWLEAHMGAPQLHYTPLIWLNWRAWKIKQFDRFDTFFFISCALRLLKSDFFLDRWRDDGSTIATMFNQKLSMNAHNSQKRETKISFLTHFFHFTSEVRSLSWSHCIIPVIFMRWLPSEKYIFFLSWPVSCRGACFGPNQQI